MKSIAAIASITVLLLTGCASGNAIVTSNTRPAIPVSEVKVYFDAPQKYETIGMVTASGTGMVSGYQGNLGVAMEELKKQAAQIGANGVLLNPSDAMEISTLVSHSANVTARAIYVIGK